MVIARNAVPQSGEALLGALYEYAFRQRIAQVQELLVSSGGWHQQPILIANCDPTNDARARDGCLGLMQVRKSAACIVIRSVTCTTGMWSASSASKMEKKFCEAPDAVRQYLCTKPARSDCHTCGSCTKRARPLVSFEKTPMSHEDS